jgi:hypothetical protein
VEGIGVRSTTTRAHAIATMRAQDVAQRVGDLVRITIAGADPRAVQRSLLWWHGPGESEMPHTDANRPVIANWWFPRRGAI